MPDDTDVANGVRGGVSWRITKDFRLVIFPTNGTSGTIVGHDGDTWPWAGGAFTSVIVYPGVSIEGSAAGMFQNSRKVEKIDLSGLRTDGVTNMARMFYRCNNLKTMDLSSFDPSNVTDMREMFYNCSGLTTLDLSSFDTGSVTDMGRMFDNCSGLTTLDLSSFDTGNVTDMSSMFDNCRGLTTLDLSSFDTGNVTNMSSMFYNCRGLTTLNLSSFDTGNVTDMRYMFSDCSGLTTLDLSSFDTGNVTDMSNMFKNDQQLANVYVSEKWKKEKVGRSGDMFSNCAKLPNFNSSQIDKTHADYSETGYLTYKEYVDKDMVFAADDFAHGTVGDGVSWRVTKDYALIIYPTNGVEGTWERSSFSEQPWDTYRNNIKSVKVKKHVILKNKADRLFSALSKADTIDLRGLDTSGTKQMDGMFRYCYSLTKLTLGENFDTSNVTTMSEMFDGCQALRQLDLGPKFDTSNVTYMEEMFRYCYSLKELDLGVKFNTANVGSMNYMFYQCKALRKLNLGDAFDTSNVSAMNHMFAECEALEELNLGEKFTTPNVTTMYEMFKNCQSLKFLDLSSFDTSKVMDMGPMFDGCSSLVSLDISGFDTSKAGTYSMFKDTDSLTNIALGSASKFSSNIYDKQARSGWTRYANLSNQRKDAPEYQYLYDYDGSAPGWYTLDKDSIDYSTVTETYTSMQGDHEGIGWNKVSDDTWTYTFHVYNDEAQYFLYEEAIKDFVSDTDMTRYQIINGEDGKNVKGATINNVKDRYETGDLKVTKTVTGENLTETDKTRKFKFKLTLTDEQGKVPASFAGSVIKNDIIFEDGVGVFYLAHGEQFALEDLETGIHYKVEESATGEFTTTSTDESGVIITDQEKVAAFVNEKIPENPPEEEKPTNGFILKKVIDGNMASADDVFTFYITLTGLEAGTEYSFSNEQMFTTKDDGSADVTVTLKGGESVSLMRLPIGATYKITEEASEYIAKYTITDAQKTGKISQSSNSNDEANTSLATMDEQVDEKEEITVTFTNKKEDLTTEFSFKKIDASSKAAIAGVQFALSGTTSDGEPVGLNAESDATGMVSFGKLSIGTYTLKELSAPEEYIVPSAEYTVDVTQTKDGSIKLSMIDHTGEEVTKLDQLYAIENKRKTSLSVSKTVVAEGNAQPDANERFTFTLTRVVKSGDAETEVPEKDMPYTVQAGDKIVRNGKTSSDGTFTLRNAETAVFNSMDPAIYRVTEQVTSEYELVEMQGDKAVVLDKASKDARLTEDGNAQIAFTNRYRDKQLNFSIVKSDDETGLAMSGVKFKLYHDSVAVGNEITDNSHTDGVFATDAQGKLTFSPIGEGTYYLVETETLDGYILPEGNARKLVVTREKKEFNTQEKIYLSVDDILYAESNGDVTIAYDDKGNNTAALNVTNTKSDHGEIRVVKKGDGGKALAGVEFTLTKKGDTTFKVTKTTGADGTLSFDQLADSEYILTETKTLPGYQLMSDAIEIVMPLAMTKEEAQKNKADITDAVLGKDGIYRFYSLGYTVTNQAKFDMPVSGKNENIVWVVTIVMLAGLYITLQNSENKKKQSKAGK